MRKNPGTLRCPWCNRIRQGEIWGLERRDYYVTYTLGICQRCETANYRSVLLPSHPLAAGPGQDRGPAGPARIQVKPMP